MSVFERLQQRLARGSTTVRPQDTAQICHKNSSANSDQLPPMNYVIKVVEDRPTHQTTETMNNLPPSYKHPRTWGSHSHSSRILPNMSNSCSIPSLPTTDTSVFKDNVTPDLEVGISKSHFSRSQDFLNVPNTSSVTLNQQPRTKRAKTPLSSFYRVSSDDDDDGDEEEDVDDDADVGNNNVDNLDQCDEINIRRSAAFERKSQRVRRSIDRAKAALPADFADRIEISDSVTDLPNQELSSETHFRKHRRSVSNLGNDLNGPLDTHDPSSEENISDPRNSENEHYETQETLKSIENITELSAKEEKPCEIDDTCNVKSTDNSELTSPHEEQSDNTTAATPSDHLPKCGESLESSLLTGIHWHPGPPQPLSELMSDFRSGSSGKTYLIKAICKRAGCRCALRNYDSLMLYPVPDSTLASATWETWTAKDKDPRFPATVCEVQSKLILFRQCRGWYEVLNENYQPTPHITTIEQVRRTRSSTFIVRQDMRCLVAPPTLVIPSSSETQGANDDPSPLSLPPNLVSLACSPETLAYSKPDIIRAGTLLRYITYLPDCSLRRGKKIKEMELVLATERSNSTKQMAITSDLLPVKPPSRTIYLGTEDSTPAVFPPKLSLSTIAGPENISGVHLLSGLLRKFRLPLSIRPIPLPDSYNHSINGPPMSRPSLFNTSRKVTSGLVAVQSLMFTEKHFLRLHSIYRGDILIIAPVASPERLFLITPSMLRDHSFQIGFTHDANYALLMENHRIQACNFLAIAHAHETLNYLVRHMQDVTREPRDSYTSRQQAKQRSDLPPAPESYMSQDEICKAYDEIDDIYFYIRHGYYPSKVRKPDDVTCESESASTNTVKDQKYSTSSSHISEDNQFKTNYKEDSKASRIAMLGDSDLSALHTPVNSKTRRTAYKPPTVDDDYSFDMEKMRELLDLVGRRAFGEPSGEYGV
ncbi:unnamed protein product [Trichobilharzia szidati]|nr:unnamed protein product [Trichobilharzia szidati]